MVCPVCGTPIEQGSICPACNVDGALYFKVRVAAAKLYNKGLQQAREGDLSGAQLSLTNSLRLDKYNIQARNLLGLVYYEKGRMGDALKQWIISNSMLKKNNRASQYIQGMQNHGRELEQANDGVRMFNQSRNYLLQGSGDLAVIQLKKALGINPKLVEAQTLLALCYLQAGEKVKAEQVLKKVLQRDIRNPQARAYLEALGVAVPKTIHKEKERPQVQRPKNRPKKATTVRHEKRIADSLKSSGKRLLVTAPTEIAAFVLGLVLTAIVMLTLVMPVMVDNREQKVEELTTQLTESKEKTAAMEEELNTLRTTNETLMQELSAYRTQEDLNSKQAALNKAREEMENGSPGTAALALLDMDTSGMTPEMLSSFEALKTEAFSLGSQSFYNAGRTAFLDGDFEGALPYFENALKLTKDEDFVDDAVYYIGRIAQETGDKAKAIRYFQRVIDEFPESNQYQNAVNQLNGLQ